MIDATVPLGEEVTKPLAEEEKKQENNKELPATGFHTNPERINRNGRPKKSYSISEAFREMLGESKEKKEAIVRKIYEAAEKGDMVAAKMIWQYMDGMPAQAIDMTTLGEKMETKTIILTSKPKAVKVTNE